MKQLYTLRGILLLFEKNCICIEATNLKWRRPWNQPASVLFMVFQRLYLIIGHNNQFSH